METYWQWELYWRVARHVMEMIEPRNCKLCGSANTVRFGHYRGEQRYWCNACRHKFTDKDTLPHGHVPIGHIATAVSAYFNGMSFRQAATHVHEATGSYVDGSTVYDWVRQFGRKAEAVTKDDRPNVGDVWVADETVLTIDAGGKTGGKKPRVWFFDIIDAKTRFLLASFVSKTRSKRAVQRVMEAAAKRAGRQPRIVLTDSLATYPEGIDNAFGSDTQHMASEGFGSATNTNLIERFHSTLKSRTKVLRGLKSVDTANEFLDSWLFYYNYLRGHESLNGKTPAEYAGLKPKFQSFGDVTRQAAPSNQLPVQEAPKDTEVPHVRTSDTMRSRQLLGPKVRISKPRPRITEPRPRLPR